MKIKLPVAKLGAALDFISSVVPKKSPVQILNHCKLVVDDGKLTGTATDLDIALVWEIEEPDIQSGGATAPCIRLKKLVNELPASDQVTLALDGSRLRISCGRGRWAFPTFPAEDFPVLPGPPEGAASFVIPGKEARRLLQRVAFAVSQEKTRYYLNGINLHAVGHELRAAATDGHRLAETIVPVDPGKMPAVILPYKLVDVLSDIASSNDITVRVTEARVEFGAADRRVISKLIDGKFPDYARLLPSASENRVSVDATALLAAIKRLNAVIDAKAMDRTVGLEWGDGKFSVCLAREDNAGIEEIDPICCLGFGRVAAQAHYLMDQLEALDAASVVIDHAGESMPIRITRPDEQATTTIVMPMSWHRPTTAAEPIRKRAKAGR